MEEEKIEQFYLLLTESQAKFLKNFNENVRRCATDAEKLSLCGEMRSHLLEQHNSLGMFFAVTEQTHEKLEDEEEWHRFIGVAASGSEVIDKCLPNLRIASLAWGRDKIQHYRWHDRGWGFCKKVGTVAKMMGWQEFVIKTNRLLWHRATVELKYRRRRIRDSPDPLDQNELLCLKDWLGEHSYIKDKDPDQIELKPEVLAPGELPDGFGFDKFGLLVRSQHALSAAQDGASAASTGSNTATLTDPELVNGSSRSVDQDTTMVSAPSEAASEALSNDLTVFDSTCSPHSNFIPMCEGTDSGVPITPGSSPCSDPGANAEENVIQAADDDHNATEDSIAGNDEPALRWEKGQVLKPTSENSEHRTEETSPLGTSNPEQCCPVTVPTELLRILDLGTLDHAATLRVLTNDFSYSDGALPRDLCVKHLRKFAEALLISEQDGRDAATGLRRRRASLTDADGHPTYRRIRLDEHSYSQRPLAITITQEGRPTHDHVGDEAFRMQALHQLETKRRKAALSSHVEVADDLVYNILLESTTPVISDSSTAEAHFWSGDEATVGVEVRPLGVPIFTQGQQRFRWREGRLIRQLFHRIVDFDRLVPIRIPSLGGPGFQHKALGEVKERFLAARSTTEPWSLLDLQSPLPPSILPFFLDSENCQLLSQMRDAIQPLAGANRLTELSRLGRE